MRHGKRVFVVVPAFEEAPRIGRVIASMPSFVDAIVIVDDASKDGTSAAARECAERCGDGRVTVLRHDVNRGVGAAIVTGYRWALASGADGAVEADRAGGAAAGVDGAASPRDRALAALRASANTANTANASNTANAANTANTANAWSAADASHVANPAAPARASGGGDAFAVMAGDGQMDAADLAAVVDPVLRGEHGYVKGNRFRRAGTLRAMPVARRLGGEVFSRLTSLAIGVRIEDSQCGYTAISRAACGALDLDDLWPRFGYPNDLLGQLARRGISIGEVPVRAIYADEQSKLRARHTVRIAALVARAFVRRQADTLRSRLRR